MEKLKKLLNRETILYIVFGVATTVVNYIVFHLLYNVLWQQENSLTANAAAFVAAVIFRLRGQQALRLREQELERCHPEAGGPFLPGGPDRLLRH